MDPATDTVYVTDYYDGTVSVIDGATNTVTATIPVGSGPDGVGVDPATDTVYVTNFNDGTVSVIDGATNTVTATIPVGLQPFGVGVNPATHAVYVTNYNHGTDGTVSVITPDAATQLADLYQAVQGVGPGNGLSDKVAQAQAYLASGDIPDACATLGAFIHEVSAQSGKSIPPATADALIADARQIQAVLAC